MQIEYCVKGRSTFSLRQSECTDMRINYLGSRPKNQAVRSIKSPLDVLRIKSWNHVLFCIILISLTGTCLRSCIATAVESSDRYTVPKSCHDRTTKCKCILLPTRQIALPPLRPCSLCLPKSTQATCQILVTC